MNTLGGRQCAGAFFALQTGAKGVGPRLRRNQTLRRMKDPVGFRGSPQTLLIDADDTLWENNVYFERAIARFISFLNHHEFTSTSSYGISKNSSVAGKTFGGRILR